MNRRPSTRGSVQVDGRTLSYLEWSGSDLAAPPTIILLHGGNSAAADWQDVAEALQGSFRMLAPDLRGRGFSEWDADQDYSVAATEADLEAWRTLLHLERFVLGGHSFGAVVALAYAAHHPQHVERLVLFDGGPVPERSPAERTSRRPAVGDLPVEFPSFAAALEFQRSRNPAIQPDLHQRLAENHFRTEADGRVKWRSDVLGQAKWFATNDPDFYDQWPFVEALRSPTLVIRGGASPLFGAAIAQRMVATNPLVQVTEVPGAGHSVHHEKPAESIAALQAFLAEPARR